MQPFNPATRSVTIEELFDRHSSRLFAYLCQHTPAREDAEDLLVETFLSAMAERKFAHLSESAQVAWLWRVARNKTIDTFRQSAVRRDLSLEHAYETASTDETLNPEEMLVRQDEAREVANLLRSLSPQQREILQLRFSHDLRCSEIATILGKREEAVRTTLSRAMNLLRQLYIQRKAARELANNQPAREGGSV